MATLTLTSQAGLLANVHFATSTVREVVVVDLGGGVVRLEIADAEVGISLVGALDVLRAVVAEAHYYLAVHGQAGPSA